MLITSKLQEAFHMNCILHEAADLVAQVHYPRSKGVASLKHVSCWGSPGSQNLVTEQPLNESHGLACSCGSCRSQQIHQAQVHNTAHLPVKEYQYFCTLVGKQLAVWHQHAAVKGMPVRC